ncbi:MAG TPA: hypothetical protein VFS08_07235 [Gemmatimonadaceae bacterium]|nr:hypothetical protein [Gemmatimonadaceae bacterium]
MSGVPTPPPDGAALAVRLRALGVTGTVEAQGRLALLRAADAAPLMELELRRRVHAAASECGFTHVALELDGTGADEALRSA